MTTILCDTRYGLMGADSYQASCDRRIHVGPKIASLDCGLVAHSGDHEDGLLWREWLCAGADPGQRPSLSDNFGGLLLDRAGKLWMHCNKCVGMPITVPYFGFGAGSDYAMGALYAGADMVMALRAAAHWNIFTAPPFILYDLKSNAPVIVEN